MSRSREFYQQLANRVVEEENNHYRQGWNDCAEAVMMHDKPWTEPNGTVVDSPPADEMVTHPPHYTWLKEKCGIEVWDITQWLPGNLANVVKYVLRADLKGAQLEDLKKARQYLDHEIARVTTAQ
jgi:hypothetical protein